jgi:hypothetical protein
MAVVLVIAGAVAFVLARPTRSTPPPHANRVSSQPAAINVSLAAIWVTTQVSRTAIVACDPAMCRTLQAAGIPVANLLELSSPKVNPLRSDVIVATQAVRSLFHSRLTSVYAPTVLASFGSGSSRIDIRAIAPHGVAAYRSALTKDIAARKAAAMQLLHSPQIKVSAKARRQLAAGQVDPRLIVDISGLASHQTIMIASFGDLPTGASPGVPLRSADLAETRQLAGKVRAAYQRSMLQFLQTQHGLYQPTLLESLQVDGQYVIRIEFPAPSPLGLLGPQSGA